MIVFFLDLLFGEFRKSVRLKNKTHTHTKRNDDLISEGYLMITYRCEETYSSPSDKVDRHH
jgi:hypothetical protein